VLLTEGHQKRGMPLERVAEVSATAPARLMGPASPRDQSLSATTPLTCVDLGKPWRLEGSDVVSGAGYSIHEGWLFQGAIVHAMSRGQFVLRDGTLKDSAVGLGRFVKRKL
jgi:dihydroorotase-like cyclic amidohydrolase